MGFMISMISIAEYADYASDVYSLELFPACINCHAHLLKYIQYMELHHFKESLTQTDYIFPAMSINSVVQRGQHTSTETVQGWLDMTVKYAGIDGLSGFKFSTHCFWWGGPQYHLMEAPHGQCWPIGRIRWWGGWAEHEHVGSISYLILVKFCEYRVTHLSDIWLMSLKLEQSVMEMHFLQSNGKLAILL